MQRTYLKHVLWMNNTYRTCHWQLLPDTYQLRYSILDFLKYDYILKKFQSFIGSLFIQPF
jgi:hypothetical protein